jgi:hypothetical protein
MADENLPHPTPTPAPAYTPPTFGSKPATPPADTKPDLSTAAAKLRAFEDKHLGRRAMRNMDGHVERGYGSPFKALSPELLAEHSALEKLVEAEAKVDHANAKLSAAKTSLEAAKAAVVEATKVSDAAALEAKKAADEEAKEAKADAAATK